MDPVLHPSVKLKARVIELWIRNKTSFGHAALSGTGNVTRPEAPRPELSEKDEMSACSAFLRLTRRAA